MDGYGSGNESMEMTPIFLRKCGKQETIRKHKKAKRKSVMKTKNENTLGNVKIKSQT